jgi:hypothetical protein
MRAGRVAAVVLAVLAGCGGGGGGGQRADATGPIARACNGSDRQQANPQSCACIQVVANQRLSGADQRRGARFFRDPDRAQDVRLSDTPANDAFWERWTEFGQAVEAQCIRR